MLTFPALFVCLNPCFLKTYFHVNLSAGGWEKGGAEEDGFFLFCKRYAEIALKILTEWL